MVHQPLHRATDGGFPPHGGASDLGDTSLALKRQDLGIPPVGGGYLGGRFGSDGDLYLQVPEYGLAIHCYTTYSGPLPVGIYFLGLRYSSKVQGGGFGDGDRSYIVGEYDK